MTIDQLNKIMASGEPLLAGSQASKQMMALSAEARKLTMKINTVYHEPHELQELFAQLTGKAVEPTFSLFPPFYTDYGKNIRIGKGVFLNAGCHFQDQGGITIGDGTLIGHNVVLATLNHTFTLKIVVRFIQHPLRLGRMSGLAQMQRSWLV